MIRISLKISLKGDKFVFLSCIKRIKASFFSQSGLQGGILFYQTGCISEIALLKSECRCKIMLKIFAYSKTSL